jgi:hypothetical protein
MRAAILILGLLALPAAGQDKKADPKKKEAPEPKTWMCKKGELLWHETFEGTAFSKDWHKGQGEWAVESGQLRGAEQPADKHHAYCSRKVTEPNAILQFAFKLDGAQWLGGFFDGKEHVAALSISADMIRLRRMSGIGPTSKSTEVDATKAKLDDKQWHTVVWEFYGDEMVATVDDQHMALAKAEGLSMERLHLELNTAGGKSAFFKDVKIWKAELDPKWPQKRAQLLQLMKKKPAAVGYK